jgi:hypothetical protein
MKTIKLFTIGFAWVCWLFALVIWSKLSWLLLIGGVIPYLIQNQYVDNSITNEDDEKNKNQS